MGRIRKTIASQEELIQWAKEVNMGLSLKEKCDYQDYYARAVYKDLERWFIEANGNRKLIACSVYNTMAYGEVERLLLAWAVYQANKKVSETIEAWNTEYDKREGELHKKERAFAESRKTIFKRFAGLRRRIEQLQDTVDRLRNNERQLVEDRRHWERQAGQCREKAERFDSLRELLQIG